MSEANPDPGAIPLHVQYRSPAIIFWPPQPEADLRPGDTNPKHRQLGWTTIRGLTFGQERSPGFVLMVIDAPSTDSASMDWADYLRDQATMYRQLAEQTNDSSVESEMLELASVCEEVANNMEDHLTGG
jgi:hypothetical protein